MRVDADRSEYWRRRIVALGGVLAVAGALMWACGGQGDEPARKADTVAVTPPPTAMPPVMPTATPSVMPTAVPTVTVTVRKGGRGCDPDDLVVTMRATRDLYAGTSPRFWVTVVNMDEEPCSFDTGSLDVRVTSGTDRIWSFAQCGKGMPRILRRGVPFADTITWDRRRACGGAEVRPGTYVASLVGAGEQVFRLR